jgi:uncharacterized protein
LTALNDEALLIEREAALSYRQQCAAQQAAASDGSSRQGGQGWERGHQTEPASIGGSHRGGSSVDSRTSAEDKPAMKAFFGSIALDPLRAKMDFATIMDASPQSWALRSRYLWTFKRGVLKALTTLCSAASKRTAMC